MDQVLELLNAAIASKMGTAFAAFALALLSVVLQQVPAVKEFVAKNAVFSKVSMLVLAVIPAVVLSLTTKASWFEALMTAVLTFLGALGLETFKEPVVTFLKKLFSKA